MATNDDISSFARELNRLCAERWPGGSRSANAELAEYITTYTGRTTDRQSVWRIRKGRVHRVDADVRDALCAFFGVPPDHFSTRGGPSERSTFGSDVDDALDEMKVQLAGLRSSGDLTEQGRAELASLIREVGKLLQREAGQ